MMPHVHIASDLNLDGAVRNLVGVAGDLPSTVTTGCGLRVPRGKTSRSPDGVTCRACRQDAHQPYLAYADQIERLDQLPGMNITAAQIRSAAGRSREIAREFLDMDDRQDPGPDDAG